jgi:hypothetical protein
MSYVAYLVFISSSLDFRSCVRNTLLRFSGVWIRLRRGRIILCLVTGEGARVRCEVRISWRDLLGVAISGGGCSGRETGNWRICCSVG